jgi:hypothetical protein
MNPDSIENFFKWSLTHTKKTEILKPVFDFSLVERDTVGIIGGEENMDKIKSKIQENVDLDDVCECYINKSNIVYKKETKEILVVKLLRSYEFYERNGFLSKENPEKSLLVEEYDFLECELDLEEKEWIINNVDLDKLLLYFESELNPKPKKEMRNKVSTKRGKTLMRLIKKIKSVGEESSSKEIFDSLFVVDN